jgi:hypothetical protein
MEVGKARHRRNAATDAVGMGTRKGTRHSEARLVELFRQAHDTAEMLENLALCKQAQRSAIDLFKIDLDLAPRCLYLLHPGQAVGGLLQRKYFLRVLFHGAIALP